METSKNIAKITTYENYLKELFLITREKRTINSLVSDISKLADKHAKKYIFPEDDLSIQQTEYEQKYNKTTGGLFECFHILFNKVFENDPEVGLKCYSSTTTNEDFGTDATGINVNGIKVACQDKFRNNVRDLITYGDICKTVVSGQFSFGIDIKQKYSIWLFTTGTPSHILTNYFGTNLKVIDRKLISRKIDNNNSFWEECWRLLQNIEELQ